MAGVLTLGSGHPRDLDATTRPRLQEFRRPPKHQPYRTRRLGPEHLQSAAPRRNRRRRLAGRQRERPAAIDCSAIPPLTSLSPRPGFRPWKFKPGDGELLHALRRELPLQRRLSASRFQRRPAGSRSHGSGGRLPQFPSGRQQPEVLQMDSFRVHAALHLSAEPLLSR